MKLTEIYSTIRESSSEDWYYIPFHSGNGGNYQTEEGRDGPLNQPHRIVFRDDVSLVIDYGLDDREELEFDHISEAYPSFIKGGTTMMTRERIDILWNGTIVDRAFFLSNHSHKIWVPAADHFGEDQAVTETDVRLLELMFVMEVDRSTLHATPIRDVLDRIGVPVHAGDPFRSQK